MPRSKLLLIDEDTVFCQAFRIWLEAVAEVICVTDAATALATLATNPIDLVVLNLRQGLPLCQQIRAQNSQLPILVLSDRPEPVLLTAAQNAGATGYCAKNLEPSLLLNAIRTVAAGQAYWQRPIAKSPLARLRGELRQSGTRRIDAVLAEVTAQLQQEVAPLDRAFLAGRQRELRAARWLVNRLLTTASVEPAESIAPPDSEIVPPSLPAAEPAPALTVVEPQQVTQISVDVLQRLLWDRVAAKLQGGLQNYANVPLEIDILRSDKKRELFYLILRRIEDLLAELRFAKVSPDQLFENRSLILQDLWQAIVTDFFGKYALLELNHHSIAMVETLLQDQETIHSAILDRIPDTSRLLAHLLYRSPLVIDGQPQSAGNPEALLRAELLLENLMIQLANSVIQPLLNRFGNVAIVQENFYDARLMSVREVERFRNNLSWKYRLTQLVIEPKAIFESRYLLLFFSSRGIEQTAIYAPRTEELDRLMGVPLVVTIALEARDAIAPRLRSTLSVLGSGVVYVLTEVVGRGIGLIGRGILKGLGNAWQDVRSSRDRRW